MEIGANPRKLSRDARSGQWAAAVLLSGGWMAASGSVGAADVPGEETSASQGLAEIVVTANKREQNLNDVGLAVAVLGENDLKDRGISSLEGIAQAVPGLSVTPTNTGAPVYTLRGIGFYEISLGAYSTVPVYIDEFPLSFPATTSHSAFDLERVEVLKGPQGTLFGQNATGGAINLIAAKPTKEFEAGNLFTYGRFNEVDYEAYVSGPLTDGLTARAALRYERMDGWQVSNTRPGDTNGRKNNVMARILLDYRPIDVLHFQLNLNGWKESGETIAPQYAALIPQAPVPAPDVASAPFSPRTPRAADWTPGLPYKYNYMGQAALRGDLDLTDAITLTSLTSFVSYNQDQRDDADGLPQITGDLAIEKGDIRTFAQELRVSNGGKASIRWVAGGNFEHSTIKQSIDDVFPDSSDALLFGPLGYPNFNIVDQSSQQKVTNRAAFGNTEFDLNPEFTLNAGVRYTKSDRDAILCSRDPGPQPGVGEFFYQALYGGAYGPYAGQCYPVNDTSHVINGVPPGTPGVYASALDESNVSWRTGVNWKPMKGMLLYGNVAKGFKAGSFPTCIFRSFVNAVSSAM